LVLQNFTNFEVMGNFIFFFVQSRGDSERMPRLYKRPLGVRQNMYYSPIYFQEALRHLRNRRMTLKGAAEVYGIPKTTLHRHLKCGNALKSVGGQKVLSRAEENGIEEVILCAAAWGYPFENVDIQYLV
jgi:hypothetical protein